MTTIIYRMLELFAMMALGFGAYKFGILTEEGNRIISKVVMNIALPGTILYSVLGGKVNISGGTVATFLFVVAGIYVVVTALSLLVPKLLHVPEKDAGIYKFITVFSNTGFMGYPVTQAIFGDESAFYVALFGVVFNLFAFSVGIAFIKGEREKLNLKSVMNLSMIVTVIAVLLLLLNFKMPTVIVDITSSLNNLTTPLSMLVIGSTLASTPLKEVFGQWQIYPLTAIRLLVVPVIAMLIAGIFISDEYIKGIIMILFGMPGAALTTMLCIEYGGNEKTASNAVFITTVASIVTIPLLVYLFLI